MAEYLELEKVLDDKNIITVQTKEYGSIDVIPVDTITDIELSDVQPVKRGYWYHNTSKYISELDAYFIQVCCSCCGRYSDRIDSYTATMSNDFCSHCGADMRGEEVRTCPLTTYPTKCTDKCEECTCGGEKIKDGDTE